MELPSEPSLLIPLANFAICWGLSIFGAAIKIVYGATLGENVQFHD